METSHGHGLGDGNGADGDIENVEVFGGKDSSEVSDKNIINTSSYSHSQPLLVKRINTTSQIAIVGANICPIESLDYE